MADPKKGTGRKPKGSGRRLYTDENPKDTVSISYKTPTDARQTVAKVKKIKKPFARKIQILTVMEQRAKVAGKRLQAEIGQSKNGELSQVNLVLRQESVIYLLPLLNLCQIKSMLLPLGKKEKIPRRVNNIVNNLRRLQRKQGHIENDGRV